MPPWYLLSTLTGYHHARIMALGRGHASKAKPSLDDAARRLAHLHREQRSEDEN